jgi:hypothetical protein
MFPFYYNSETKESKFYKEYDFQVEYVYSSIEIIGKTFSKASYDAGENVSLEIALYNSGDAEDVVLSTVIREGN